MRTFKSAGGTVAATLLALGVCAIAAGAASAASTLELYSVAGVVKPGDETTLALGQGNAGPGVQKTVTVETADGNVTCESEPTLNEEELPGTDLTNDEKSDELKLGGAALFKGTSFHCSSTLLGGPSAEIEWYAPFSPFSLGTLSLGANHKAELSAPSTDVVALRPGDDEECQYTYTKLKGTLLGDGPVNEVQPEFTKQKLKEDKAESGARCPKKATISFSIFYALTHTNDAVAYTINS
jgi:hypothetical protein